MNWKNRVACKISRFKSNWEYLGIVKNELDKRNVNKRVEIIEAFIEIRSELYQYIIKNCVDSKIRRILKWIEVKEDKTGY